MRQRKMCFVKMPALSTCMSEFVPFLLKFKKVCKYLATLS